MLIRLGLTSTSDGRVALLLVPRFFIRRDVLETVKFVQQQILDPFRAVALERAGPEVARDVRQLLGERDDLQLEHDPLNQMRVVDHNQHQIHQILRRL